MVYNITNRAGYEQLAESALINEIIDTLNVVIDEYTAEGHIHNVTDIQQLQTILDNLRNAIPTRTSQLNNDAGFATREETKCDTVLDGKSDKPVTNRAIYDFLQYVLTQKSGGLATKNELNAIIEDPGFFGDANELRLEFNSMDLSSPIAQFPIHQYTPPSGIGEMPQGQPASTPAAITPQFFSDLVTAMVQLRRKAEAVHTHNISDVNGLSSIRSFIDLIKPYAQRSFHYEDELPTLNDIQAKRTVLGSLSLYGLWHTTEGEWFAILNGTRSVFTPERSIIVNGVIVNGGSSTYLWVGDKVSLASYANDAYADTMWVIEESAYSHVLKAESNGTTVYVESLDEEGYTVTTDVNYAMQIAIDEGEYAGRIVPIGSHSEESAGVVIDESAVEQLKAIGVDFADDDKELLTYEEYRSIPDKKFRYYFVAKDNDGKRQKKCWRIYLCKQLVGIFNLDGQLVLPAFPLRFPFILT